MNCELSYSKIKTANEARISEEIRDEQRRRNLLVLILHHLAEEGYLETCRVLESEVGGATLARYRVCDNIDLTTVLQEYESYYYVKFNKYPKITKKIESANGSGSSKGGMPPKPKRTGSGKGGSTPALPVIPSPPPPSSSSTSSSMSTSQRRGSGGSGGGKLARGSTGKSKETKTGEASKAKKEAASGEAKEDVESLNLAGTSALHNRNQPGIRKGMVVDMREILRATIRQESHVIQDHEEKLLKPIAGFAGYNTEMRELAAVISRDIYLHNPDVRWNDIMGLEEPKRLVKEAVVYPIKYPQLFTGILSPWKGLLLYGPPGTGKTMLAKAVATECNTTFFNISASTIVSKWRGDSEKLVRILFELARFHAPSTIFIDELESIMSQRGYSGSGEHEGSRRMKTELLVQMDGLAKSSEMVFLLAASNLPWELDHAMLRRLEKRILVDLPNREGRKAMLYHHLPPVLSGELELQTELDYDSLATATEGYTGSDIRLVCKEAAMRPLRKVFSRLEGQGHDGAALSGDQLQLDPLLQEDVEAALARTKPSAHALKDRYIEWQRQYESV